MDNPVSYARMGIALQGIKVIDLTRVRSGPMAVRQLADWGADVLKVEATEAMDKTATMSAGRFTGDFQNTHRNKKSLTLNLKDPRGVEILTRLVEKADVLVENFRPGVADRLGIGYAALSRLNPRLVYASITGFGDSGPYALRPGFDQIVQGLGGIMGVTGSPETGPQRVGIPLADLLAGLNAAIGILTALVERSGSGLGQHMTTSLLEGQISILDLQATRWLTEGENPPLPGNMHPVQYATGTFATREGHINIACGGDMLWARLCRALPDEELDKDPDLANHGLRLENRDRLNARLADILVGKSTEEWMAIFVPLDVPCGPILDISQVFDDPQVKSLGMSFEVTADDSQRKRLVGGSFRLSRSGGGVPRPAPQRGAQTEAVLAELGYTGEAIAELRAARVV